MIELWNRPAFPVTPAPFEHVCIDDALPRELFDELAATFPECPAATGPTGFTIHRGDPEFDALMARGGAWSDLWESCNTQAFTDFVLRQFDRCFTQEAVTDLKQARHVPYLETRQEKESRKPLQSTLAPDDLWVRFDLMQGWVGYKRGMHLDHRRRAATMLIYFNGSTTSDGGDLVLHATDGHTTTVTPKANRLVMFPCNNTSWHSVSPIVRQDHPRNFLQITVSSAADLWEPLPMGLGERLREGLRSLAGRR